MGLFDNVGQQMKNQAQAIQASSQPAPQKTSYQQNLAKPVQQNTNWYKGAMPTTTEMYGRIAYISQYDANAARQIATGFAQAQQTVGSPWYNPYLQATNQAVGVLKSYGINPVDLTDEWFQQNTEWQNHLIYGNVTNTPQSPMNRKGATDQQKLAYSIYQYRYSMEQTKKAQEEAKALREEISYKANDPNHNWSDDEIIRGIDWEKKYSTLAKAKESAAAGKPMEFNDAIAFSDDDMRGWIWAARNNGGTGDGRADMAMYANGEGKGWTDNPELTAMWNWNDKNTYRPYKAGMTLDPEVGLYFGVYSFDQRTLEKLRRTIDQNDETSMEMYQKAANAWNNTQAAEAQRKNLYDWLNKHIEGWNEDKLLRQLDKLLEKSEYSMLKKMDDSIENGSELVELTQAVDYCKQDVIAYIHEMKEKQGSLGTAAGIANGTISPITGVAKSQDEINQEAEDILRISHIANGDGSSFSGASHEDELRAAYDTVNGAGAYDQAMAAANSGNTASQAQEDSDAYVNDTVGDLEEDLKPAENARLTGYSGASDAAQAVVKETKQDYAEGKADATALAAQNYARERKNYAEGVMKVFYDTSKYETTQANLDRWQKEIEEIKASLGVKTYRGLENEPTFTMEIDGNQYRVTMSDDMSEVKAIDNVNNSEFPAPVYANFGMYEDPDEYDDDTRVWDTVLKSGEVEKFQSEYNDKAANIQAANEAEMSADEQLQLETLRELEIQVEDAQKFLSDNKAQYDKNLAEFNRVADRWDTHLQNMADLGADTTDALSVNVFMNYLLGFAEYEATQWSKYNPTYAYEQRIANGEDRSVVLEQAQQEHEEMLEQIKDIEWAKEYADRCGIKIAGSYLQNMDRRLEKIQRDLKDYDYFALQFADNFDTIVAAGKSEEYANRRKSRAFGIPSLYGNLSEEEYFNAVGKVGVGNIDDLSPDSLAFKSGGMSTFMSEDEKNTWYYLNALDKVNGTHNASDYLSFLSDMEYGVLWVRQHEDVEKQAREMTGSGILGFGAANTAAVALSPTNAMLSLGYNVYNMTTGSEANPYSPFLIHSTARTAVRSQSAEEILHTFGKKNVDPVTGEETYEETAWSKIFQAGYEMASNRLDSLANQIAFGGFFGGIKGEKLREFLSAMPMGISAGTEAIARAKERGATNIQALGVGILTTLAETATEAISLENMSSAFKHGADPKTYKEFLINWLTKAGVSEMVGESVNDIVENLSDEWIMGQMSEHAERVYAYRKAGYGPNEAEWAARKDEVKGVLRTALISYLTPGLDVFSFTAGRISNYGEMTSRLNKEDPSKHLTIRQVRKDVIAKQREQAKEEKAAKAEAKKESKEPVKPSGPIDYDALEERYGKGNWTEENAAKNAEAQAKADAEAAAKTEAENKAKEKASKFTVDFEILESAKGDNKAAKEAKISAVLDEGTTVEETDTANATAVNLASVFGENVDVVGEMQDLMTGAKTANVDQSTIKQALQYAALGGEQSQARQVVQSEAYRTATPDVKATMLAETVQADKRNAAVAKAMKLAVHDDRVAKQIGMQIALGDADTIVAMKAALELAEQETNKAQTALDTQYQVEAAAREAQQKAAEAAINEPANDLLRKEHDAALDKFIAQSRVTQEYEQHLAKIAKKEQTERAKTERAKQKALSDLRKKAEAAVAQEDQIRAELKAKERVEAQQQEIEQQKQAAAKEEADNAHNADVDEFIERNYKDATDEQKQHVRERAEAVRQKQPEISASEIINRKKISKKIEKKYGVKIQVVDTSKGGKVLRQNGHYDPSTNTITIDTETSVNELMYFVLGHELTHVAESSQTYGELASAMLQLAYGIDVDYDALVKSLNNGTATGIIAADVIAKKSLYDKSLAKMHQQDSSISGEPISYTEALQEIIADSMGKLLNGNNQELIKRLVSSKPTVARRIVETIKNFLKKGESINGEWRNNAQRTVDLFEKALKEAKRNNEKNGHKTKFNLDTPVEELENGLVATHSLKYDDIRKMFKFSGIPAPSLAVSQIQKGTGSDFFGPITFVFDKNTIDPQANADNQVFGRDAWTPTFPATKKGLFGTRFVQDGSKVTAENAVNLMKQQKMKNGVIDNQFFDAETPDFSDNEQMAHHIASELSKNYRSIEEIQADRERFGTKSQDEVNAELDNIAKGLDGLKERIISEIEASGRNIDEIYDDRNQGMAKELVQAFRVVASGSQEMIDYLGLSPETVEAVQSMLDKIQNIHVNYAEAKPMRVVDWGEVMVAAVPSDAPSDVIDFLEGKGIQVEYYDDQKGRAKTLNDSDVVRNLKFSLPETTVIASDDQGDALAEELPGGTVSLNTDRRYSLSSFDENEQARVRQALIDSGRFTEEEVDKYLTDALGIASMIAADRQRLDFEANPVQRFLKPNNDYYFTLDASTLCAKRLLYQGTFDYVQHEMPDEVFTPEDLIDLVNIMAEMGYETPCGICYVESRRRWLDTYAQKFLDDIQKDADSFIEKRFKKASAEEKAALRERFAGELPSIEDLTTSDGLEKLRTSDPLMHKAFVAAMNAKGTANPKVVQLRTEYRGDISKLTAKDIQKVKDIGGLRIQSFSDFETPHLLDMIQAVMDMSAVGLTAQAYTKVPNFAWVFGDTGIKINLSLIGKGTGLDADGKLVFDNVEGMNFDEAMKLRERYSKNVGTILVGINDDHIIAAMADSRIDFIIPFHKSGWSDAEMKGIPSLNHYKDYTDSQNEKKLFGKDKDGNWIRNSDGSYKTIPGKESKLKNFEPVGSHKYWEFEHDGEWNARKYLKMCAEDGRVPKFSEFLVDNGDGSFSLPEGDDERSTAIRTGYWKTLIDFKMYDNDGNGAAQAEVTPNINMDQAHRVMNEHKLGRQMPDRDGKKGAFIPMESNNDTPVAVPAGDAFIEKIRQKRRGNKPSGPNDTLKATPPTIQVTSKESAFHQNGEGEQGAPNAKSAAMASNADLTLGNAEIAQEETAPAKQQQMAIDAETGETRRYSLPSDEEIDRVFEDYIAGLSLEEMEDLAMKEFGISLKTPSKADTQVKADQSTANMPTSSSTTVSEPVAQLRNMYKDAIERGDIDEANGIIDKIAKKAGYTVRGTHRTNAEFTVFEKSKRSGKNGKTLGDGFYVAAGENTEYDNDTYGKNRKLVYIRPGKVLDVQKRGLTKKQAQQVYDKYFAPYHPNAIGDDNPYTRHVMTQLQKGWKVVDYIKEAADNANVTTDVIFKELGYDSLKDGPQYALFDSEQIKLADPITYDDDGKEIDIGKRFDRRNPDIRYSLPSDAPYLAAVERGEMDEAQRMVDEKAREAGYNIRAIHGTNAEFTVFEKGDIGYHFGTEAQATAKANQKANNHGGEKRMIDSYIKMENPLVLDFDAYSWDAPLMAVRYIAYEDHVKAGMPYDESETSTKVYKMFKSLGITDADIERLRSWDDGNQYFDEILERNGYDGIIYRNEVESDEGAYSYIVPLNKRGNIKEAAPVTYDDQGRMIPLSERFDTGKKDIRFSLPSDDVLDQQLRYYFDEGGSMSEDASPDQRLVDRGIFTPEELKRMNRSDKGTGERQFSTETSQKSDVIDQDVLDYLYAHRHYVKDTNAQELARALKWIKRNGEESGTNGFEESLDKILNNPTGYLTKDGQAKMVAMIGMAAASRNARAQAQLMSIFDKQGTNLGQAFQARKLFTLMTPEGRQMAVQRMLENTQAELAKKNVDVTLEFSEWIYKAAAAAEEEGDFQKVMDAAYQELGEQIPANWKDRLRSIRMLSMLANPRTHIRNIIGNALFIPAVGLKNKMGALMELGVAKGERTKTLALTLPKDIRDFSRQDAVHIQDVLTGEAKFSEGTKIKQNQEMFGKFFKALSDFNSNALEAEDWFFLKGHYRRALGGWMVANGYTVEQMKSNPELLEKGRAYAVEEAQKATYRDFNKTAQVLNEASRKGGFVGFMVDAALPFKKTPANILRRGIEYSPVGIVKSLTSDMIHMKQYLDYQNGKLSVMPEKAMSPAQVIDHLCAGLSGTAVMALGFFLAGSGIVTCGMDDDDDKFDETKGVQKYAVKFSLFGEDVTFTMDWAAPMSMPFFVGAAIRNQTEKEGGVDLEQAFNAFGNISEPVFNLSMLDGINSLLKTSSYDETPVLTQILSKVVTNYAGSYVPSVFGAFARTFDDKQRKAFVEQGKNKGVMGNVRYMLEQAQNKIPGYNQQNIAVRNIWGEEKTSGLVERILENFILPGYVSKVEDDPIIDEMGRLYDLTGDPKMIPDEDPDKSITYTAPTTKEKITHVLTDKEWDRYKEVRGKTAYAGLSELINNADYKNATAAVQVQMIKDVWSRADKAGKNAIIPDIEVGSGDVASIARESKVTGYKNEMIKALDAGNYEAYDTMVQALLDSDVEEREIATKISNNYRNMYKAAYRKGDTARMLEIEEILDYTDLGIDYEKWQDQVDNED